MQQHNRTSICISHYTMDDSTLDAALETDDRLQPPANDSDDSNVLLDELTAQHYGCLDSQLVRELEHDKWAYSEWPHTSAIPA